MSDVLRSKGARRVNPFFVPKIMSSCNSANLATAFKIKGFNYSISSACATSSHCLGNAFHTIQNGLQDRMFVVAEVRCGAQSHEHVGSVLCSGVRRPNDPPRWRLRR